VLFEGTGNVVQESANLFWDNTNGRLGIGTSSPDQDITLSKTTDGIASISILNGSGGTTASSRLYLGSTQTQVGKLGGNYTTGSIFKSGDLFLYNQTVGNITFWNNLSTGNINFATGSGTTAQMTIAPTGNVLINTTTDAGYKLDVNGTARVRTTLNVGSTSQNGLINLCRSGDGVALSTITQTSGQLIINNGQGSGIQFNTVDVNYFHVRGFASQFAVNVTGALTSNAGFTRALLVNNVINANANNVELAAVYISPTFNNLAFTGVKNIAIQSASGGAHFNTTSVEVSSILQADSTTQGFLPPRMTTTQINAIASPADGLQVYNTTISHMCVYQAGSWVKINHSPM
jgi:hypothetical protein